MTNQHPITPPEELVDQWRMDYMNRGRAFLGIAKEIAQWGADQELKACCEWLTKEGLACFPMRAMREARRPKPPTLKEQALDALELFIPFIESENKRAEGETIRRALEALPND